MSLFETIIVLVLSSILATIITIFPEGLNTEQRLVIFAGSFACFSLFTGFSLAYLNDGNPGTRKDYGF